VQDKKEIWDLVIQPRNKWLNFNFKALWRYKDLLLLLVKRDFVTIYHQTILGPLWFFMQPILNTLVFTVVFSNMAQISTDGVPSVLFYLGGLTMWNYFADTLTKTADTFVANASVFGKVYFPRLIIPISVVISNLFRFGVQMMLFLVVWTYYMIKGQVHPNMHLLLFPLLIIILAFLGLGFGSLVSSLTTKYRDLKFLVGFGVQLVMYASPIVYPLSLIRERYPQYEWLAVLNPITSILETFKYATCGNGIFEWGYLLYSFCFSVFILLAGMMFFNRIEKSFMDTV
jgi:lipopolysaccharide transport system permease protein